MKSAAYPPDHTGFGDCACDACFPVEPLTPLADHDKPSRWSWYDPMTPPHYALFILGVALGAVLVGLAWTVWLWA